MSGHCEWEEILARGLLDGGQAETRLHVKSQGGQGIVGWKTGLEVRREE